MDAVEVERDVTIPIEQITLYGTLRLPRNPQGIVVFAHGSGSSRFSPRNVHVARQFAKAGFASLLFDLLTNAEERIDTITAHIRFNIPFLADRMVAATKWLYTQHDIRELPIGFFGASTGGGAAIEAAAKLERESDELGPRVRAVVSRGGRPDLASDLALRSITCPVLLIVGGEDRVVINLNRSALEALGTKGTAEILAVYLNWC